MFTWAAISSLSNSLFCNRLPSAASLAPPTYLLPLNFHFTSVLGLDLLNMNAFHVNQISGGPISEQREWLRTIKSRSHASFSSSQRKTIEKDTREAIRSVVGSLPKIDQLKNKLCRVLLVAMMLWRFSPPGLGKVCFSSWLH